MPNAITSQTLVDGPRNTIVKITIVGDGSGEETNTVLFDASSYGYGSTNNKLMRIQYLLNGFDAVLYWDATANVVIKPLDQDIEEDSDFSDAGGIINNGGTGRTGDILISTNGLGSGDEGYIVLYIKQRGA